MLVSTNSVKAKNRRQGGNATPRISEMLTNGLGDLTVAQLTHKKIYYEINKTKEIDDSCSET